MQFRALPDLLSDKRLTLYSGFDPTADSLHVGNLLTIISLLRFQSYGHKPIFLIGGGTAQIGDPSGKSRERTMQTEETIFENSKSIRNQIKNIFKNFSVVDEPCIMNNIEWIKGMRLLDALSDIGRHFRVSEMLARDSVKTRLNSSAGISFTEFCYQTLQAYDFLYLYENRGCELQIGGSDQWGNISAGIDLIRRKKSKPSFGLTTPLLTTNSGQKIGKTEGNAIWLEGNKTSPYDFYQYFHRQDDRDLNRMLNFLTFLPSEQISEILKEHEIDPAKRLAQKILAEEVTRMVHGHAGLRYASLASEILFQDKTMNNLDSFIDTFCGNPRYHQIRFDDLKLNLSEILVRKGIFGSKKDIKNLTKSGGLYLNGKRITSTGFHLDVEHFVGKKLIFIRKGRKDFAILHLKNQSAD